MLGREVFPQGEDAQPIQRWGVSLEREWMEDTTSGESSLPDGLSSVVYTLEQPASPRVLTPGTHHSTHP